MKNHVPSWRATLVASLCSFSVVMGLGYLFIALVTTR